MLLPPRSMKGKQVWTAVQNKHLVREYCFHLFALCCVCSAGSNLSSLLRRAWGTPGTAVDWLLPARCKVLSIMQLVHPSHHVLLWQVRDTLGALAERCAALKIDGSALHVSRLMRAESHGLAVKRITMYSPNWVKSQNRMSSTSNQVRCLMTADFTPRVSLLGIGHM
jgi:hypothetical protein